GLALAFWALRQAGLRMQAATRTLLAFLVVLYSVFLGSVLFSGIALASGLVTVRGPVELGAIPAAVAALGIVSALALAGKGRVEPDAGTNDAPDVVQQGSRIKVSAQFVGDAVRDALGLIRLGDARLAGATAYWAFDAAVLWAMLHAFGSPPVLPVIVLAYFVGQVANTLPIPGSVSGGIASVLIAFGVAPALAVPAVLAYRTIAVWLPIPAAIAAVPTLRTTIARWRGESGAVASHRQTTRTAAADPPADPLFTSPLRECRGVPLAPIAPIGRKDVPAGSGAARQVAGVALKRQSSLVDLSYCCD